MATDHVGIVFATFEKTEVYAANLAYFLEHGVLTPPVVASHADLHFVIVVNGALTTETEARLHRGVETALASGIDVRLIRRDNSGFDFAAYHVGIEALYARPDVLPGLQYVVCINASTRGPFLPQYCYDAGLRWVDLFTARLKARTHGHDLKLVGPTINVLKRGGTIQPHVQSYAFAIARDALDHVRERGIFGTAYTSLHDVIENQEIGLSASILAAGWNIGSFAREYAGIDFRPTHPRHRALCGFNGAADIYAGDTVFPGGRCFGRDCHPFELMFVKSNRGVAATDIHVLCMPLQEDMPRVSPVSPLPPQPQPV
jgi:hypothetical protein